MAASLNILPWSVFCLIVTAVTVIGIKTKLIHMRFFDREQEFEKLREIEELSHEAAQFTIITGRRRIGKTEMVKKFYETI